MKCVANAIIVAIIFMGVLACTKDKEEKVGAQGVYEVDPAFEPFVDQFIREGAKRGHQIDFSDTGLRIEFSDRELEFAGGFCYLGQHHIVINKAIWGQTGFVDYKMRLIFHELGHCALGRSHRNDRFGNSVWKSLMRGDPLNQAERRIPVPFYGFRKEYYIDELFDEAVSDPDWADESFDFLEIDSSHKRAVIEQDSLSRFFQFVDRPLNNYEIEVRFNLPGRTSQATKLQWDAGEISYVLTFYNENLYTIDAIDGETSVFLFRATNGGNINGRRVDRIHIRRHGGYEKIFLNEAFIFHLDELPAPLKSVRFESTDLQTNAFIMDLDVRYIGISEIK